MKKRRLRNMRPKALLGLGDAASAAVITAGATMAGATLQAAAAAKAAAEQSHSIERNAEQQAQVIQQQGENNAALQEKSINAQRENFNRINETLNTTNMNIAMAAGQESAEDRRKEGLISVKYGGSIKNKRKRNRRLARVPLPGSNSLLPFTVLDGGGAVFRGETPYGNLIYELYGNDHDHYHRAQGGKYKSGVGIKTLDGTVFEAEGNQNGNQGEILMVPKDNPTDIKAISRRSINGINPARAISQGASPEEMYAYQELSKGNYNPLLEEGYAKYGGSTKLRLRHMARPKALYGIPTRTFTDPPTSLTFTYNNNTYTVPYNESIFSIDDLFTQDEFSNIPQDQRQAVYDAYRNAYDNYTFNSTPRTATDMTMDLTNSNNSNTSKPWYERLNDANDPIWNSDIAKAAIDKYNNDYKDYGLTFTPGVTKLDIDIVKQLFPQDNIYEESPNWQTYASPTTNAINNDNVTNNVDVITKAPQNITGTTTNPDVKNNFWKTPTAGAIINTAGQLAGAGINAIGNRMASHKLTDAYGRAANIMSNAYSNLKTVDVDDVIRESDWVNASYIPSFRSARYNINPQLADIDKLRQTQALATNRNTLSGAARLARMSELNSRLQDERSKIYAQQMNQEEAIKQKNIEQANKAAADNANMANTRRSTLTNARLDLAKYNNDIVNERIMGAANARSQMGINAASARANAMTNTAQAFGSAFTNSAQGFVNAFNTEYNARQNFINTLAGANLENQARTILAAYNTGTPIDNAWAFQVYSSLPSDSPLRSQLNNVFSFNQ